MSERLWVGEGVEVPGEEGVDLPVLHDQPWGEKKGGIGAQGGGRLSKKNSEFGAEYKFQTHH